MFSIDFYTLQTKITDLKKVWEVLEEWLLAHRNARAISPVAILQFAKKRRSIGFDDGLALVQALEILADRGVLKRVFAVQSPAGTILHPYYSSRTSIPKKVRGNAEEWVDTIDAEIRPLFVGASENE